MAANPQMGPTRDNLIEADPDVSIISGVVECKTSLTYSEAL